ncbi:MAG: thiamine phosphate synthase [Endomicrobiales bacterium]|nr:thiamine phosphate synthase [Endomicrobiales bacterium]
MTKRIKGYYFITDASLSRSGNLSDVRNAVACGVGVVQYRGKDVTAKNMMKEALCFKRICKKAVFIVNDRVDVALACGADGVHLGQDDMPYGAARRLLGKNKIIGVTVHGVKEAKRAQKEGADYLGVSPIFSTSTKKDAGNPAGLKLIKDIRKFAKIPLVAIGGINTENAGSVIEAGADAVCAISCVVASKDPKGAIRKLQSYFNKRPKCK